eukprot:scaffold10816_cov149-Skeletonema_dohrnii-CCMP3373.AAC.5
MKILQLFPASIFVLSCCNEAAQARNIVTTNNGIAIATTNQSGLRRSLVTYDANTSQQDVHQFSNLPNTIRGFDDVALDSDGDVVAFAIDASSGLVCSFNLSARSSTRRGKVSLQLIGCTTQRVSTSPFVGIDAQRGTLVVSGGTGGVSTFRYDTSTGRLSSRPTIRNQSLNEIGHPSVTLVSRNMAALCTDTRSGFGITIANINQSSRSLDRSRSYLYVANGPVTVQNPRRNGSPTVVNVPNGFEALTVDVNSDRSIAVFGGVIQNGARSAYLELDISDPLNPKVVTMEVVSGQGRGRITGVASAGQDIFYVFDDDSSSIGHARIQQTLLEDSEKTICSIPSPVA